MADQSNIIINYTDHVSGKAQQKTITNINPAASSADLATWGAMTAALTKDTYSKTTRIDRTECDTPKATRTTSKLRWESSSHSATNVPSDGIINISTADVAKGSSSYAKITIGIKISDQLILPTTSISSSVSTEEWAVVTMSYTTSNNVYSTKDEWAITFSLTNGNNPVAQTVTIDITFPETNTSAAWSKTLTFNITEEEG